MSIIRTLVLDRGDEIVIWRRSHNLPLLVPKNRLFVSSVIIKHSHSLLCCLNLSLDRVVVRNILILALWLVLIVIASPLPFIWVVLRVRVLIQIVDW